VRGGQLKKSVEVLGCIDVHDVPLQFFALILADDIAAERSEFSTAHRAMVYDSKRFDSVGLCDMRICFLGP
jgi:hypothetical protein